MNHHDELEHYLKTATRGIFGKRKLEVREELEAHVLERARKHELLGLSREAAIFNSLSELGSARMIRSGLLKTHAAKPVVSLVCLGLMLLGFLALPSSPQQRLPFSNPSLKIDVVPIPLARAGMARTRGIPLSKLGDAHFAAIPLAKPPVVVPIKAR